MTLSDDSDHPFIAFDCGPGDAIKLKYISDIKIMDEVSFNGIPNPYGGAIFCKGSLEISSIGSGSDKLTIITDRANGIWADGDLTITGGEVEIDTVQNGIVAGGNLNISGCKLTINAPDDGIKVAGNLDIRDCELTINVPDDGINVAGNLDIRDCELDITAGKNGIIAGGDVNISNCSGTVKTTGSPFLSVAAAGALTTTGVSVKGLDSSGDYTVASDIGQYNSGGGTVNTFVDAADTGAPLRDIRLDTGPDVSPKTLNLNLNGSASKPLAVSLGGLNKRAATAGITVNAGYEDYISVDTDSLNSDGTVNVTGHRVVNGAKLTVSFSGGDLSAPEDIDVTVNVTDSTSQPPPPRKRSSGKSNTRETVAPVIPSTLTVDAPTAKTALAEREKSGAGKARIRHNGEIKVLAEAWQAFGNVPVDFDTMDGDSVQVRVTVNEPGKMTGDRLLSGYVKGAEVDKIKARFEKWYKNKMQVIHFDQQGDFGQPVEIAAKLDLTGMDTGNLYFYSYDKKTNTYKRIENPAYWIDKSGYLHFTTEYAGDIVISEGPLEKK